MYKRFLISGSRPLAARLGAGAGRRQQRRGYRAQASSSSGEAGNVAQRAVGDLSKWLLVGPLAGVLGGGAAFALSRQEAGLETVSHEHYEASKRSHPWVQAICDEPGTQLVSHGRAGRRVGQSPVRRRLACVPCGNAAPRTPASLAAIPMFASGPAGAPANCSCLSTHCQVASSRC